MVGVNMAVPAKISTIEKDADLVMGAHSITLGAGQTVDGKDVSALVENIVQVRTGTYTGDGAINKEIVTGFATVKGILIYHRDTGWGVCALDNHPTSYGVDIPAGSRLDFFHSAMSGGSVFVDDDGTDRHPNISGAPYIWIAWGI